MWRKFATLFNDFTPTAQLPATEADVADAIGRAAAVRLSRRIYFTNPYWRGQTSMIGALYVPSRISAEFVERVGDEEIAHKLISSFSGEPLFFTGCAGIFREARDHAIRHLWTRGVGLNELSRASFLTSRMVRRVCNGVAAGERRALMEFPDEARALNALCFVLAQRPISRDLGGQQGRQRGKRHSEAAVVHEQDDRDNTAG